MKNIVLLTVPSSTNRTPEECLGLEYLVAESVQAGHRVTYIDAWMDGLTIKEVANKVIQINPDVVGMSPSMDSIENSKILSHNLRERGYAGHIIMGGIYASFEARSIIEVLEDKIDGIITGEADTTFQAYLKSCSLVGIPGAVYRMNGVIVTEPGLCGVDNLDKLPFPIRDSLKKVISAKTPSHVMGSRGCYGNCSFCSVACFQKFSSIKRWRGRSADSIVPELKYLAKKGETMVKFIDDNWFGGHDKTRELAIAKKIQEAGINMRFRISLRVNDVTDDLIRELKKAGLFAVSLGVESFVQRKLNDYNKGTTVEQNLRALKILEKNRVFVQMGHIMFDPFIRLDEIEEELKYLERTSWAVTKGICTQIFAAEGTEITDTIRSKVGFVGKRGTNYLYKIQDRNAQLFYNSIKPWARHTSSLYDMVIDPISAPKNIPNESHLAFHQLCTTLRKLDLEVANELVRLVKSGSSNNFKLFSETMINKHSSLLSGVNNESRKLYYENGLNPSENINNYIY